MFQYDYFDNHLQIIRNTLCLYQIQFLILMKINLHVGWLLGFRGNSIKKLNAIKKEKTQCVNNQTNEGMLL